MAEVAKSKVSLRVYAENLNPEEITKKLECEPSFSQSKGQELVGPQSGRKRIAPTGMWRLETNERKPENINSQIEELLAQLTPKLKTWDSINKLYKIDLFCGLFMEQYNEGFDLSPKSMKLLSERGITIGFDIYESDNGS